LAVENLFSGGTLAPKKNQTEMYRYNTYDYSADVFFFVEVDDVDQKHLHNKKC